MVKYALFELVKSMTMSEKRYFKIYSSKHVIGQSNDYVLLFDFIDKSICYEEDELLRQSFVRNLSAEKNYLYNLVLKSLNAFHASFNSKTKIYQLLESIEILYHKGLYQQALKLVKKAFKIAHGSELFTQCLVLNEIKTELLSKQFQYEEASLNISEANEVLDIIKNFNTIQEITTNSYSQQVKMGLSRSNEDSNLLDKFVNDRKINKPEFTKSNRALMYINGLNLTYSYFVGNKVETLKYAKLMTDLYESESYLIEYSTIGYVSSLYNLVNAYLENDLESNALNVLTKLENVKDKFGIPTSYNISARVFIYSSNIRLGLYLNHDKYEESKFLIESNNVSLEKYKSYVVKPQLYEYYFLIAKYYIVSGEYKKALSYTNLILNDSGFKLRDDLLSVVKLMNILIQFELNRDFSIEYLTKNTLNYFKKKKRLYKVENEIIKFMSFQDKIDGRKNIMVELEQLRDAMKEYKKDKYESIPFKLFDFEYWATAKIQNKRICDSILPD